MVSFVCEFCQETLKKAKLDQHKSRCRNAQFTCIDCSTTFQGIDYRKHTSCISEAEKYQKSLYKGPKKQNNNQQQNQQKTPKANDANGTKANIAKPPQSESLIAQIQKVEAAKSSEETPAQSGNQNEQPVDAGTKRPREDENVEAAADGKKKKKSKKGISEENPAAEKSSDVVDETPKENGNRDSDFATNVSSVVLKVLKKNPELSIAQLRKKAVKRLSKQFKDLGNDELVRKFDDNLIVAYQNGTVCLKQ